MTLSRMRERSVGSDGARVEDDDESIGEIDSNRLGDECRQTFVVSGATVRSRSNEKRAGHALRDDAAEHR